MFIQIFLLLIVASFSSCEDPDDFAYPPEEGILLKDLDSGRIRGRKHVTPAGTEGYVFLSIPVAEPPVGDLRFKKPVPRSPWRGIHDATNYTVSCYWNSTITTAYTDDFVMDEDCIQLHIFTNKFCLQNGGCAVIFYVHGGNFAFGTPLHFNQNTLVDNFCNSSRNVVMVTASFRNAAFSSLNLNWKLPLSADLNAGLHDIVFEMEWVKKNIKLFGGDPNRLTLMGHSGGANVVNYLAVSPKAQTLFNQLAIMSRGSQSDELIPDRNQKASRMTAIKLGCTSADESDEKWENVTFVEDVIDCLRNKTAREISSWQKILEPDGYIFQSVSLDYGDDALLPTIYELLDKKRLPTPLITGTVSREFLDSRDTLQTLTLVNQKALREWCQVLPKMMGYAASESALDLCMVEYNTTSKSINLYDDVCFYVPTAELSISAANQGAPTYLYQFEYEEIGNAYYPGRNLPQLAKEETPTHAQELVYLMGQHLGNFTAKDKQIQFLYSQIFVDFVNFGTPNTIDRKWDKFDPLRLNYFVIDYPDPTLANPGQRDGYHRREYEFWSKEFPKVAGNRRIIRNESEFVDIVFTNDTSPEMPSNFEGAGGTNWQLFFWIAFALLMIALIFAILSWIVANRKKHDYQEM